MISEILKDEFHQRCTRNPRYSLRSFAKSIGVSHTLLSLIINEQRQPSRKFLEKTSSIQQSYNARVILRNKPQERSVTEFSQFATWVHYAVLSYLDVPISTLSETEIAEVFGVNRLIAKTAIKDLKRCKLIERTEGGKWRQVGAPIVVNNKKANAACSGFIREYLNKAQEAMDYVPFEMRDLRAMTFAMNVKDLDYARQRLATFRRELCDELEQRSVPNMVVTLNTNLFSLSKIIGE